MGRVHLEKYPWEVAAWENSLGNNIIFYTNVVIANYKHFLLLEMEAPEAGVAKGLTLILDSHTDLQTEKSIGDDFIGFLVGVSKGGDYSLLDESSILLSPGHQHYLALTATNIQSSNLQSIDPTVRNCLYPGTKFNERELPS